jgi:hypothetical protein
MANRLLFITIGLVALVGAVGVYSPTRAQEQQPTIVCAPCAGKDFGVQADQGMVLLAADGNLWFYPLNRASPMRIGTLGPAGTPIRWVTTP